MKLISVESQRSVQAFGISMKEVLRGQEVPLEASWGSVPVNGATTYHAHDEFETIFFVGGRGEVITNSTCAAVRAGDAIRLVAFERHTIKNSGDTELQFLTTYWRDSGAAAGQAELREQGHQVGPVYVFSTPPTPNGDLHLGHLSGPYLAAEVLTRSLRMHQTEAYHLSGSDDYQSYVAAKAKQRGDGPEDTADHFAREIRTTLDVNHITLDYFGRPSKNDDYRNTIAQTFRELYQAGHIVEREEAALFDTVTGEYLHEAFVSGLCPSCGKSCGGNICEDCGMPNSCVDIIEPRSAAGGQCEVRLCRRLYFDLAKYSAAIEAHHGEARIDARAQTVFERLRANGLPAVAVTHPGNWGIRPAVDGYEAQVIWVWFEMALGFLYAIRELQREKKIGELDERTLPQRAKIVHFFGFDNAFYHTVLFPAIYRALFGANVLDIDYICNEFYLLEGMKFSTSRGHAVWGRDLVASTDVDQIRFFLAYTRPEVHRTNFSLAELQGVVQSEFSDCWHRWARDLHDKVVEGFGGQLPSPGSWTQAHIRFYGHLNALLRELDHAYGISSFSLRRAARLLCDIVREAQEFGLSQSHWNGVCGRRPEYRTAVALEVAAARTLAHVAFPLMPGFARRLWRAFGGAEEDLLLWPVTVQLTFSGRVSGQLEDFFNIADTECQMHSTRTSSTGVDV